MQNLSASTILNKTMLGDDPGYLAGRGATISDVDGIDLEKIYRGIFAAHGAPAANAFLGLIDSIDVLSGAEIIRSVYALERNNWQLDRNEFSSRKPHLDEVSNEAQAYALVAAGLTNSGGFGIRDDSQRIRDDFSLIHRTMQEVQEPITIDNWANLTAPKGSYRAR